MILAVLLAANAAASQLELQSFLQNGRQYLAAAAVVDGTSTAAVVNFGDVPSTIAATRNGSAFMVVGSIEYAVNMSTSHATSSLRFADLRSYDSTVVTLCLRTITTGNYKRDMVVDEIATATCASLETCVFKKDDNNFVVSPYMLEHTIPNGALKLANEWTVEGNATGNTTVLALPLLEQRLCISTDGSTFTLFAVDEFSTKTELFSMLIMLVGIVLWAIPSIDGINNKSKNAVNTVGGSNDTKTHIMLCDFVSTALSLVLIRAITMYGSEFNIYRTHTSGDTQDAMSAMITTDIVLSAIVCVVCVLRCRQTVAPVPPTEKNALIRLYLACGKGKEVDGVLARTMYEHVIVLTFLSCIPRALGSQFYHCVAVASGVVMQFVAGRDFQLGRMLPQQYWHTLLRPAMCLLHIAVFTLVSTVPLIARSGAFSDDALVTVCVAVGTTMTVTVCGVYTGTVMDTNKKQ